MNNNHYLKQLYFFATLILLSGFLLGSCKQQENPEDSLNLKISAKGITGKEEITLMINSNKIKSWKLENEFKEYAIKIDSGLVQIHFSNAGENKSALVDYIQLNGKRYEAEAQTINTSVFQNGTCGGANSEMMNCEGFIQFFSNTINKKTSASKINLTDKKQIIRGFGGATVFSPYAGWNLNDSDLNLLYGNGGGQIGLNILRIRVASDENPSWRNLELTHAKEVIERGGIVMATPWSPPARMKTNNNLIGGALKAESYNAYATYLNDFADFMSNNGAPLYAISVQNEPDIKVSYESCDWTANQMYDFVKNNATAITSTQVMAPESFNFNHLMSDAILLDDNAVGNIDIIGGHIYGSGLADYQLARNKGKELWMTEHLDTDTTWVAVFKTGREIHDCLAIGNFSAYLWWYVKRFYGPLDENGVVSKRGYVMANFAKFIRFGNHRIAATENPQTAIRVSAYQGEKAVIVAINEGDTALEQQFAFENGTIGKVSSYITSQSRNLAKGNDIKVINNIFSFTLPAKSITTFVQAD